MSGLVGYLNTPVKIITGADAPDAKEWVFDDLGNIVLPQGGNIFDYDGNNLTGTGNISFNGDIIENNLGNPIILSTGTNNFTFGNSGELILPNNSFIRQNRVITKCITSDVTTGLPTVVWSSHTSAISSAKLLIQIEQDPGDSTADNSQSCEAIIAAKGTDGTDIPVMTVYGITYTGLSSLATFSIQRNITTNLIELVATLINTTDPAYLSIYSVEQLTRGI